MFFEKWAISWIEGLLHTHSKEVMAHVIELGFIWMKAILFLYIFI